LTFKEMGMNNEPVAWMSVELDGRTVLATYEFETAIPLYIHPAKTLTEIIEKNKPEIEKANAYIKSLEDEIEALKAKTLTDEEIEEIYNEILIHDKKSSIKFARAILKKASEK